MKRSILLAAILAISAVAASGVAAPQFQIQIRPFGVLTDDGHAAMVYVNITCEAFPDASTQSNVARLRQGSGDDLVIGSREFGPVVCDGIQHSYRVFPRNNDATFTGGPVVASIDLIHCNADESECREGHDQRLIHLIETS